MDYLFLAQLLINGVVIGLIYGLIAAGLSLQFGILHIVNFAHGEFVMISMYALALLLPLLGGSYLLAVMAMLILSVGAGWFAAKGFFLAVERRNSGSGAFGKGVFEKSLLLTLGLSIVLLNGVQYLFTATPKMLETGIPFGAFAFGGVRISYGYTVAASTALTTFAALFWFLMRTNSGRALRAVAQNREAALNIGLDPERVARRTIVISVVLSAVAGAALAPFYVLQPNIGQFMLLKAFAVVIIGGMGNVLGAAVTALGLGVLESLVGGYTDTVWQNAIAFAAMIVVLIVRPTGLFPATLRQG